MGLPPDHPRAPHRSIPWRTAAALTLAGGAAFWLANFVISLTPIAAEYRAALSISYIPMLVEALLGGLILGFAVSVALIRLSDRVPGGGPFGKSMSMSVVALIIVTAAIEIPAKLSSGIPDPVRYFAIGAVFNIIRILALGAAIGAMASRVERIRPPTKGR